MAEEEHGDAEYQEFPGVYAYFGIKHLDQRTFK